MKRFFIAVILLASYAPAIAQDAPRIEASAGFIATHFDNRAQTFNQQGWLGTINYNAIRFGRSALAASIEGSGSYSGFSGSQCLDVYRVHAGGEYSYGSRTRGFGRVLIGRTFRDSVLFSDDAFSGLVGGGLKVPITKRLFLRTGADYLFTRFGGATQNSAQVHVGFGFGY